jgi:ATP-dependent exoDNAse (exonuclease V) beta subunit
MVGEDCTNKGRIDLSIKLNNCIYIIEFKTDGSSALSQIKEKNYHQKYLSEKLPIYLVGIEFDTKEKNISKVEYLKI